MDNLLKNKTEIIAWLDKYGVERYTLVSDAEYGYVVDVKGPVHLSGKNLTYIAVKFNIVDKSFNCSDNLLTNLEGCPKSVCRRFHCEDNKLMSLLHSPEFIGSDFNCKNNQLISLEGCPTSIGGYFSCTSNHLTSLEYGPQSVAGYFSCASNKITRNICQTVY